MRGPSQSQLPFQGMKEKDASRGVSRLGVEESLVCWKMEHLPSL